MRIEEVLQSKSITNEYQKLYLNLTFTTIWLEEKMNAIFKELGITSHQYNVLRILRGSLGAPLPACDIQSRMIYKNSNVTRIIEKLLIKDLVHKKSNEYNRRKIEVSITDQGLTLLRALDEKVMNSHNELFQNITKDQAVEFSNLLDTIRG